MSTSADSLFNYHGDLYLKSRRLRRSSQGSDDPIGLCWLRDNRQAAALREDSGPASICAVAPTQHSLAFSALPWNQPRQFCVSPAIPLPS